MSSGKSVRHYVMCPPTFFDVVYSVNVFMNPDIPTDQSIAQEQWTQLFDLLVGLGHQVELIDPVPEQPDMVFTANAGVVIDGYGVSSHFRAPYRNPETPIYHHWLADKGYVMLAPQTISEGEGDFVVQPGSRRGNGLVFAGQGVRTEPAAYGELARHLDVEVVPVPIADDRFYHLDTALTLLDPETALYVEGALTGDAVETIRKRIPRLLSVSIEDGLLLGANIVSDGFNVVAEGEAMGVRDLLEPLGYNVIGLNMSELRKSGGAVRCCVLEIY